MHCLQKGSGTPFMHSGCWIRLEYLHEGVQGAVHHGAGVAGLVPRAQVLHHLVGMENVVPDLPPPLRLFAARQLEAVTKWRLAHGTLQDTNFSVIRFNSDLPSPACGFQSPMPATREVSIRISTPPAFRCRLIWLKGTLYDRGSEGRHPAGHRQSSLRS